MKIFKFEVSVMEEDANGKEKKYRSIRTTTSKTLSGAVRKLYQEIPQMVEINKVLN